jgi:hypothetical protein
MKGADFMGINDGWGLLYIFLLILCSLPCAVAQGWFYFVKEAADE